MWLIILNLFEDILKDSKQQLFHQCAADISPTMKCSRNTLDILYEKPLCREHSLRQVRFFLLFISVFLKYFSLFYAGQRGNMIVLLITQAREVVMQLHIGEKM